MFGLDNYKLLLTSLLQHKFRFATDWNVEAKRRSVLIRHDVDFSVDDALVMAKFERGLNLRSTYFFMLTSNMYNLLSKRNRDAVLKIKEMGHKISLHFDPTVYSSLEPFLEEREIFEKAFKVDVDIISIHRPGIFLENNNIDIFGTKQTYQDQFFKRFRYISDSGGKDVTCAVSEFLKSGPQQVLHLLIHPVWWVRRLGTPTETLNKWRSEYFDIIKDEIGKNCKTYSD